MQWRGFGAGAQQAALLVGVAGDVRAAVKRRLIKANRSQHLAGRRNVIAGARMRRRGKRNVTIRKAEAFGRARSRSAAAPAAA